MAASSSLLCFWWTTLTSGRSSRVWPLDDGLAEHRPKYANFQARLFPFLSFTGIVAKEWFSYSNSVEMADSAGAGVNLFFVALVFQKTCSVEWLAPFPPSSSRCIVLSRPFAMWLFTRPITL